MRIINKDLTREKIKLFITNNQIYVEIFVKYKGKWVNETYFQSYDWKPDDEYINGVVKFIIRTWGLKNPQIIISK